MMDAHLLAKVLREQNIGFNDFNYNVNQSHGELSLRLTDRDVSRLTTLLVAGVEAKSQDRRIAELEETLESLMSTVSRRQHAWLQGIEPGS